jgi:uncharacterized RDD family membrane protein YckC
VARPGSEGRRSRLGALGSPIDRVVERFVPTVVQQVDVDEVVQQIDVDRLIQSVDMDALLARIDPNDLLDRVDVNRLLDRVDVDDLLDRVDVNRLLERVDVQSIAARADVGGLVARSTGRVAGSTLDLGRRWLVALDLMSMRFVNRVLRRRPGTLPLGPPALERNWVTAGPARRAAVTGQYAGPVSRLVAAAVDGAAVTALYSAIIASGAFALSLVTAWEIDADQASGLPGAIGFGVWAFLYMYAGLAVAGRTLGKLLVGLRVVRRDGSPLPGRSAFVRVATYPLSFVLSGLGLLGIVVGRERRALHDVLASTAVVYDWGERPAEMPAPITRWFARHGVDDVDPGSAVLAHGRGPPPAPVAGDDAPT